MAKGGRERSSSESTAGTGHFYTTKRTSGPPRRSLEFSKFWATRSVARKHVPYRKSNMEAIASGTRLTLVERLLH